MAAMDSQLFRHRKAGKQRSTSNKRRWIVMVLALYSILWLWWKEVKQLATTFQEYNTLPPTTHQQQPYQQVVSTSATLQFPVPSSTTTSTAATTPPPTLPSATTNSPTTTLSSATLIPFDESLYSELISQGHDFCVAWSINTDDWWTHQPEWRITHENHTHYCFGQMRNPVKAAFFRALYRLQFPLSCNTTLTRQMVNQGWGADMRGVYQGLAYAMEHDQTVQFYLKEPWIYTVGPQHQRPGVAQREFINKQAAQQQACPLVSMECYFLPLTSCPADPNNVQQGHMPKAPPLDSQQGGWIFEYAARPRTYLRRRVYTYLSNPNTLYRKNPTKAACTVIHVRRADVVINPFGNVTRKYYPLEDYVKAAQDHGIDMQNTTVLLLTDDQNAVEEAEYKFPALQWMYFRRQRHRGAEGGFENQIPSGDPVHEVVVLLATFATARRCSSIVHTFSSFPYYLRAIMQSRQNGTITKIDMDDGQHESGTVWKAGNHVTMNVSRNFH